MKKISTFYLTILSVITPVAVGYSQESVNADTTSSEVNVSPVVPIDNARDAVTISTSQVPENAIDVGTIGPDEPADASMAEESSIDQPASQPDFPTAATFPLEDEDEVGMLVEDVTVEEESPVVESTEVEATAESPEFMEADIEMDFSGDGEMEFPSDESAPNLAMADEEFISVDFPDEEVRTIIRNVADLYDLNVVIPQGLEGRTSIKLRNVTWRQVFEVVLEPLDHGFILDRNIIKILGNEKLRSKTDTRVFPINYALVSNLKDSLTPFVDAARGGRVQVDERTNTLIVTETPKQLTEIAEIIERLDKENPQVMIETKFIEITNTDQSNIGISWSSLNNYQLTAGPFNRLYDRTKDDSEIKTLTSNVDDVGFLDSQLANATDYTNTAARALPTNQDERNAAIAFNNTVPVDQRIPVPEEVFDYGGTSDFIDSLSEQIGITDSAVFNAQEFNVILSALESNSDVELVSNPTVVTLDGEDALIAIGTRYPIPSFTYNDERGTFEVSGFEYEDIGINLNVRPQVNNSGFIRMSIAPEVSSLAGEVNFGSAGSTAQIPIIGSRRTESEIILKDDHTLAIGGLIQKSTTNGGDRIPYLSDIPYLGKLFQSKSNDLIATNLIIFVTAKILNESGTSYRDYVDPRTLYSMGILDTDVPGNPIPDKQKNALEEIRRLRNEAARVNSELAYQAVLDKLNKKNDEEVEELMSEEPFKSRAR